MQNYWQNALTFEEYLKVAEERFHNNPDNNDEHQEYYELGLTRTNRTLKTYKVDGDQLANFKSKDFHGKILIISEPWCGDASATVPAVSKFFEAAGNEVKIIMGARNEGLIIMEDEMKAIADELIVCTDDGSYGRKALVTEPLKELCETWKPDLVVAIGPPVMMKFCTLTTRPFNIPTVVSLNTIMVDGTGMCGGCRVSINGKTKFVCVDGPEFDGFAVDWDNMMLRLGTFKAQEQEAHHRCHIGLHIQEGDA